MLSTEEKEKRLLFLWNKFYKKISGASLLLKKYRDMAGKIKVFGFPKNFKS